MQMLLLATGAVGRGLDACVLPQMVCRWLVESRRFRSLSRLRRRRLRDARRIVCASAHIAGLHFSGDHVEG